MVERRTWVVSLDGVDHVLEFVPRTPEHGATFTVDGTEVALDWHPARSTTGEPLHRAAVPVGGRLVELYWHFRTHAGAPWSALGNLAIAISSGWATSPLGVVDEQIAEVFPDADLWLTLDGQQVPERAGEPG